MKKIVTPARSGLADRASMGEDSAMPSLLDSRQLPKNAAASRALLPTREEEHAAELEAARNGLKDKALEVEQLKTRLAKLLRQRFESSSEKLRSSIDQLQPILGDLEEDEAEAASSGAEPDAPETDIRVRPRRKPKRKPLPENLPRDIVEQPTACACPKCGGALRRLGEGPRDRGRRPRKPEGHRNPGLRPRGRLTALRGISPLRGLILPCHPARAPENVLSPLRKHHPGPGAQPTDQSRPGRPRSACACAGEKVLRSPAVTPPGGNLRAKRHRSRSFHPPPSQGQAWRTGSGKPPDCYARWSRRLARMS